MIQYLNITPYSMKIRILKKCSIQDLMHYFHISKSKWNENEIVPNQKEYLENTIVTIISDQNPEFHIVPFKEIHYFYHNFSI